MQFALAVEAVKKAPKNGEGVKSGPLGLAIILLLCVAVYFLFKSMSKHMKRVREDFPATTSPPVTFTKTVTPPGDSTQVPGSAASVPPSLAPPPERE